MLSAEASAIEDSDAHTRRETDQRSIAMPILKPVRERAAPVLCKLEVLEPKHNGGGAHVALFPPRGRRSSEGNATTQKVGKN